MEQIQTNKLLQYDEGLWNIPLGITLKITHVYDSTATAIVYSKENPYHNIRTGDWLNF